MGNFLYVLSIGTSEEGNLVRDCLLARHRSRLSIVPSFRDMSGFQCAQPCEVVVLHSSLSAAELRANCNWVRREWPNARILLCAVTGEQEAPYYDERVSPNLPSGALQDTIERLAEASRRSASRPSLAWTQPPQVRKVRKCR